MAKVGGFGAIAALCAASLALQPGVASAAVVKESTIRPAWSGAEPCVWTMDYTNALSSAAAAGRYTIMMYSGMWWCPHCQALEEKVLTTEAWSEYAASDGMYLTVLDFPNRAGTGYWCWLWETNYVEAAGLTMDEAKAEVTRRYMVQDSYAAPNAAMQVNVPDWNPVTQEWDYGKLLQYRKVGYPTMLVIRPDGTVAGRFSMNKDVVSLDYVTNRIEKLKRTDAWDEKDDFRANASVLETPACEDFTLVHGEHTLSLVDRSDWYRLSVTNTVGKYWEFSFGVHGEAPAERLRVRIYQGDSGEPAVDTQVLPGEGGKLGYVPPAVGDYYMCVSMAEETSDKVPGYELSYQYMLEPAVVGFSAPEVSVASDAGSAALQVTISGASKAAEVIVDYMAEDGSAVNGVDYVLAPGSIKWKAGKNKNAQTLAIPIVATNVWKGDRVFTVTLRPQKHCAVAEVISSCKVTIKEAVARNAGKLSFKKSEAKTVHTLVEGRPYDFTVSRSGGSDGMVKAVIKVVEDGVSLGTVTNLVWQHGDASSKKFRWTPPMRDGMQSDFPGTIKLTAKSGASAGSYKSISYIRRDSHVLATFDEYNAEALGSAAKVTGDAWFYGYRPGETANPVLRSVELAKSSKLSIAVTGPAVVSLAADCFSNATMTVKLDGQLLAKRVDGTMLHIAVPDGKHTVLLTAKKGDAGSYVTADCAITALSKYKITPRLPLKSTAVRISDAVVLSGEAKTKGGQPVALAVETFAGASSATVSQLATSSGRVLSDDGVFSYPSDDAEAAALKAVLKARAKKNVYWRMDTVFVDAWGNRAVQKGAVSTFLAAAAKSAAADLSSLPAGWTVDEAAATVTPPAMTVGVPVPADLLPLAGVPVGSVVSVAVKNGTLPEGLAVEASAGGIRLVGVPVKAAKNAVFDVFLYTTAGSTKTAGASVRFVVTVCSLGSVKASYDGCRTFNDVAERGAAKLSVATNGKISGSFAFDGVDYAFTAPNFSARTNDTFYLSGVKAAAGKKKLKVDMRLDIEDSGRTCDAVIVLPDGVRYELFRNAWKTSPAKEEVAAMAGYYTAALPVASSDPEGVAPQGTGSLTFTIKANGSIQFAGFDSLGKSFSGSSVLLRRPDCCTEAPWNYAFYIESKQTGSTAAGAGIWGLVHVAEDVGEDRKYVLSADVPGLTLVNLTKKSVYGYSVWTNFLEVAGGSYDVSAPFKGNATAWRLDYALGAFENYKGRGGTSGYTLSSAPEGVSVKAKSEKKAAVTKNDWSFAISSFDAATGRFSAKFNFIYSKGTAMKNLAAEAQGVFVQRCAAGKSFWAGLYALPETAKYTTSGGSEKTYSVETPFPLEIMERGR